MSEHAINLSDERKSIALRILRDNGILDRSDISDNAKVLFVVSLLTCDDHGFASQAAVDRAMDDPSCVNIARQVMREVQG